MSERRITNKIKIAVAAVVAVLVIIVIFQNTEVVETQLLLFIKVGMPRALLLIVTLLLGVLLGLMAAIRIRRKPNA